MSEAIDNLQTAQNRAMKIRPKVGGFPYLAETMRQAGVTKNIWTLPGAQSVYITDKGPVVIQSTPLVSGVVDVPSFNEADLVKALRTDQAGKSTFTEFLKATWEAGVISYVADLANRTVTYYGCNDESYVEGYAAVEV
jgi:uncharacterized protein YbcV (DUF1398 family)